MPELKPVPSVSRAVYLAVALAFLLSATLKLVNVGVGGPHITIDDGTTFDAGFLVWFGHPPPQHLFVEGWVSGISSLLTYACRTILSGGTLGVDIVSEAYRDYLANPDPYVTVYRYLILLLDLGTAFLVFLLARMVLRDSWRGWASALATSYYLFAYNTAWCDVVARPDGLATLCSTAALLLYFRAKNGRTETLWLSAGVLGVAAGFKLHAAYLSLLIVADLIHLHGVARGSRLSAAFLFVFALFLGVTAGTPIYDPLVYVKLRLLNVQDDRSPWIHWGEQVFALLRGGGWLLPPVAVYSAWVVLRARRPPLDRRTATVVLFALAWIVLFTMVRVLRPYWMLPALPVIFIAAVFGLTRMHRRTAYAIAVLSLIIMVVQSTSQALDFWRTDYSELRSWIRSNVRQDEAIYLFGFDVIALPRSPASVAILYKGIERELDKDVAAGLGFVEYHLKNWEEETQLTLFRMGGLGDQGGFTHFSYYSCPLDRFGDLIGLDDMRYIVLQDGFQFAERPEIEAYLARNFILATEVTGPGGGGAGLQYHVYNRRSRP